MKRDKEDFSLFIILLLWKRRLIDSSQ